MRPRVLYFAALMFSVLGTSSLSAQIVNGDALTKIPLGKFVFPETFTSIEPTVVHIDGHNALCYELYVVIMSSTAAELTRVQVRSAGSEQVLLEQSGAALSAALKHSAKDAPAVGAVGR